METKQVLEGQFIVLGTENTQDLYNHITALSYSYVY